MAITVTGTATSFDNLISSLLVFAEANAGFTIENTVNNVTTNLIGAQSRTGMTVRQVSKDGLYWCFCYGPGLNFISQNARGRACISRMCYSPVVDGAFPEFTFTNPIGQSKYTPLSIYAQPESFNIPYRFIENNGSIHCIVEPFNEVFSFLSFGEIEKFTNFDGGQYLTGNSLLSYNYALFVYTNLNAQLNTIIFDEGFGGSSLNYNGFIRVMKDNTQIDFIDFARPYTTDAQAKGFVWPDNQTAALFNLFYSFSPNPGTGRAVISPSFIRFLDVDQAVNNWIVAGQVSGVGAINISNFAPKDIVDTNWIVYPLSSKTGDNSNFVNTANFGIAYYIGP